ncbi:MAG: TetR/AcrR family transcriptional regulator [Candidatus Binatia bacterium]|jgi:AcrR family transcriptional regulator
MPKTVDHDEYRKELLQKCFDLFGRMGFSNVTMRQIAEEIGVSTGTLYHYFPTKVSILEQMFAWAVEQDIQAFSPQLSPDLPLAERLARLSEFYVASGSFHQNLLLLALDLFRHSPGGSEKAFREFVDPFKEAISKSLGTDPKLSEVICTYLVGFSLHAMLTPRHFSFAEHGRFMPDVLRVLITGGDSHGESHLSRRSQKKGPPQGERKLSLENNKRTARPEERSISKGARWRESTVSCKGRRRARAATDARTAHRHRHPTRNRVRP